MKPKLILLATVLIGFVLGFLVSGQMTKHEMNEIMRWGTEDGFKEIVTEAIEPTPGQETQVNAIIDKYAGLNGELHDKWKKEHGELMRALTAELSTILTPGQMENWNKQGQHKK
ncbi:MAG: hypothetical protein HYZ14_12815 [Bacteroidetes bacterium]|nr:hypothetical protein [Bacteroidota bacterium]